MDKVSFFFFLSPFFILHLRISNKKNFLSLSATWNSLSRGHLDLSTTGLSGLAAALHLNPAIVQYVIHVDTPLFQFVSFLNSCANELLYLWHSTPPPANLSTHLSATYPHVRNYLLSPLYLTRTTGSIVCYRCRIDYDCLRTGIIVMQSFSCRPICSHCCNPFYLISEALLDFPFVLSVTITLYGYIAGLVYFRINNFSLAVAILSPEHINILFN